MSVPSTNDGILKWLPYTPTATFIFGTERAEEQMTNLVLAENDVLVCSLINPADL